MELMDILNGILSFLMGAWLGWYVATSTIEGMCSRNNAKEHKKAIGRGCKYLLVGKSSLCFCLDIAEAREEAEVGKHSNYMIAKIIETKEGPVSIFYENEGKVVLIDDPRKEA